MLTVSEKMLRVTTYIVLLLATLTFIFKLTGVININEIARGVVNKLALWGALTAGGIIASFIGGS